MRFLPSLRRAETRDGFENPSIDLAAAIIAETDGTTISSLNITPNRALQHAAVYASVRVLAESAASLPVPIYRTEGRSRLRVPEDPRWPLLNDQPNPEMYAMELHELSFAYANLWGRGYTYVVRNNAGKVSELWPLRPDRTDPVRTAGGQLAYRVTLDSGERIFLQPEQVIDIKALFGLSPVKTLREPIASAMAAEKYGSHFWTNGARPGGVIQIKETMDDAKFEEFRQRWKQGHQGLKRSQLVGILTNGAEWKDVGLSPELSQFIETRKFGVREIARLFRVPPHMIADLEGTVTKASIEQQAIEFVVYSLRPWLVRAEQAIKMRVFSRPEDRKNLLYPEFLVAALMRGDTSSRYEAYAKGIQFGFLSRADARELENLPYVDGLDTFLVPVNMMSSDALLATPALPDEAASALARLVAELAGEPDHGAQTLAQLAFAVRDPAGRKLLAAAAQDAYAKVEQDLNGPPALPAADDVDRPD